MSSLALGKCLASDSGTWSGLEGAPNIWEMQLEVLGDLIMWEYWRKTQNKKIEGGSVCGYVEPI